tara:strand:- start:124 stop:699 length:576 start_codon:yes stop_codon:yes gene_type:complete
MLIGLVGKSGSGKDTVAQHLVAAHDLIQYAFADPLKALIMDLFYMTQQQLYSEQKEVVDSRYGVSPRHLMQYLGTDVFRELYQGVWTDYFQRWHQQQVAAHADDRRVKPFSVVVSDVRYENEAQAVRNQGGVLWRISRAVAEDKEMNGGASTNHTSETALEDIKTEIIICNDATLKELYEMVDDALEESRE